MKFLLLTAITFSSFAFSKDLEKRLELLNVPDDRVTPVLEKEKLKIVNKRYSSLTNRHEFDWSGANNFNADSHMSTRNMALTYRYHLNQKWSFGYRYSNYYNELSDAGKQLFDDKNVIPDKDYSVKSTDVFVSYNTTYGKIRISDSRVMYFDQYIALGYGDISLANSTTNIKIVDLGLAFWLGKNFSSRVGLKNEFYDQEQQGGKQTTHNAMGYISFGYLFGGDRI